MYIGDGDRDNELYGGREDREAHQPEKATIRRVTLYFTHKNELMLGHQRQKTKSSAPARCLRQRTAFQATKGSKAGDDPPAPYHALGKLVSVRPHFTCIWDPEPSSNKRSKDTKLQSLDLSITIGPSSGHEPSASSVPRTVTD